MDSPFDIEHRSLFQHGLVTRAQLIDAGASKGKRRSLVGRGVLRPVDNGVYKALGAPPSWRQDLLAACLSAGPDAVASHRAAAVLWGLVDPPAPVEITVPYQHRHRPAMGIRHRSRTLRDVDRTVRHGVPATTPARTMLDLGAVAPSLVPDALERCLLERLVPTAGLWRIIEELGGHGVRGVRPLRRALEDRALGNARPHSLLEVVMADVIRTTGIRFEYQFPIVLDGHRYRLDFAAPHLQLAVHLYPPPQAARARPSRNR